MEALNNTLLRDQPLRIVPSVNKMEVNEKANLLVKNIEKEVSQQELFEKFKVYGDILSCKLETYNDGKSRGYAYVQFKNEADAEKALNGLNGEEVKGKKLDINIHEKKDLRKPQQVKFNNLFVKNLPKNTDDAALKDLFVEFGEIESAQVQKDEKGSLKDYGYVCFKDPDHAEQAVNIMNKKSIGDVFLIVSRHVSKKDNEPTHGSRITPIS